VSDLFAAPGFGALHALALRWPNQKFGYRIRMFLYAACPGVYRSSFAPRELAKR
jgi:hypothetical protein